MRTRRAPCAGASLISSSAIISPPGWARCSTFTTSFCRTIIASLRSTFRRRSTPALPLARGSRPLVTDVTARSRGRCGWRAQCLFEGAQGAMLDVIWHLSVVARQIPPRLCQLRHRHWSARLQLPVPACQGLHHARRAGPFPRAFDGYGSTCRASVMNSAR